MPARILNLGAGNNRLPAQTVSVDRIIGVRPDVVCDLNSIPWPFTSDVFEEVHCYDVLEHLEDIPATMEQIYRVCKSGARVFITTPHFSSRNSFTDPTHVHHFGIHSFDYFLHGSNGDEFAKWNFYSSARFLKKNVTVEFEKNLLNRVVWRIAKRFPHYWERRLCWVLPAWFMSIELEVKK